MHTVQALRGDARTYLTHLFGSGLEDGLAGRLSIVDHVEGPPGCRAGHRMSRPRSRAPLAGRSPSSRTPAETPPRGGGGP